MRKRSNYRPKPIKAPDVGICKFIDDHVRLVINDPATSEWQIYLNDWRMPFKAKSFSAAIKLAMGAK